MNYIHIGAFGFPKEIRDDYHADRDWPRYTVRFNAYLDTQMEFVAGLGELASKEGSEWILFVLKDCTCSSACNSNRLAS